MTVKKQNKKDPLYQLALRASIASMSMAVVLFMVLVFSQAEQLKTQMATDNQRELIPAETTTPQTPQSSESIVRPMDPAPASQPLPEAAVDAPASQPAAPAAQPAFSQPSINASTPPTGLPENMILAFALLLGIIGSATFVVLKRGI